MKNTGSQLQESKPKVIVVMPAYKGTKTLRSTDDAMPKEDITRSFDFGNAGSPTNLLR